MGRLEQQNAVVLRPKWGHGLLSAESQHESQVSRGFGPEQEYPSGLATVNRVIARQLRQARLTGSRGIKPITVVLLHFSAFS